VLLEVKGAAGSFTSPSATVPPVATTSPVTVKVVGGGGEGGGDGGGSSEPPPPHPDRTIISEDKIDVMMFLEKHLFMTPLPLVLLSLAPAAQRVTATAQER